jgi:hypothetical protein
MNHCVTLTTTHASLVEVVLVLHELGTRSVSLRHGYTYLIDGAYIQ